MENTGSLIALMGAAIAAMWGFTIWLYRTTLTRADKRIEHLETREDSTLNTLAESIKPIPPMMQAMVEALREMRIALQTQRGGSDRDRDRG